MPMSSRKGTAMQRQGHGDPSSTPTEAPEDGDDALPIDALPIADPRAADPRAADPPAADPPAADPRTVPQRGTEPGLNRYEEDEVATVPWPPPPPSQPHNIQARDIEA